MGRGDIGEEPFWPRTWHLENRRVSGTWKSCRACGLQKQSLRAYYAHKIDCPMIGQITMPGPRNLRTKQFAVLNPMFYAQPKHPEKLPAVSRQVTSAFNIQIDRSCRFHRSYRSCNDLVRKIRFETIFQITHGSPSRYWIIWLFD